MLSRLFVVLTLFISFSVFAHTETDCASAFTTLEINACLNEELQQKQDIMKHYLAAAKQRYHDETQVIEAIETGQSAWEAYKNAHCDSIYIIWMGGTIRGAMSLGCKIKLTQARTHELWSSYLTYPDSTTALLPEPELPLD
ncbi:lysozyme inhibitor LprI family protein [Methylophaga thalassica]|uniref:lysozyme inhibitor LprI family protein n=1 Tax=Methylophaga thalassica TaxID=40223 RepID=UPI002E7AEABF|nr:lysozyme inhibitor LprI family protein [Methylophaga thalassica]WVI85223.1 lysozyme inhibitor LprI family protein [Methylophaga thalassica]